MAHINATAKNAADDKLKQSLRRFADTHNPPATVVLISGGIYSLRNSAFANLHHADIKILVVNRSPSPVNIGDYIVKVLQ